MMNDTSANYFDTVKAFREYYMDRVLPGEPWEGEGSDSFEIDLASKNPMGVMLVYQAKIFTHFLTCRLVIF